MDDKYKLGMAAIIALSVIEILNLLYVGVDGGVLAAIVAAISGLGGYTLGKTT